MEYTEGKLEIKEQDIYGSDGMYIATWGGKIENAQRLVDCWNGCIGIKDPLAVGELLEMLKTAVDILRAAKCTAAILNPLEQAINKVEKEII